MTECPALTSRTEHFDFITRETLNEPVVSTFDRTVGTKVTLTCVTGLQLDGPAELECLTGGSWTYTDEIQCVPIPATTQAPDVDDDNEKILIGVLCGVAGLIVIFIFVMMCIVYCRSRKNRNDGMRDGLTKRDIAMYARQQSQYSQSQRDFDRRSRDFDRRSRDLDRQSSIYRDRPLRRSHEAVNHWEPRLSNHMYLPKDDADYDFIGYDPYAGTEWVSRGSLHGSRGSMRDLDAPGIHSSRGSSYLWRNA